MTKRKTFFSFHYKIDVWRASIIRNSQIVEAMSPAGFEDASLWEDAKAKGDSHLKKLIKDALKNTTVTVVLIGEKTSTRPWVKYEIEQSLERGNGLLGIHIDKLKDQAGQIGTKGKIPQLLTDHEADVYSWNRDKFGEWIEKAAKNARK